MDEIPNHSGKSFAEAQRMVEDETAERVLAGKWGARIKAPMIQPTVELCFQFAKEMNNEISKGNLDRANRMQAEFVDGIVEAFGELLAQYVVQVTQGDRDQTVTGIISVTRDIALHAVNAVLTGSLAKTKT
jgi:hypothetical protein